MSIPNAEAIREFFGLRTNHNNAGSGTPSSSPFKTIEIALPISQRIDTARGMTLFVPDVANLVFDLYIASEVSRHPNGAFAVESGRHLRAVYNPAADDFFVYETETPYTPYKPGIQAFVVQEPPRVRDS